MELANIGKVDPHVMNGTILVKSSNLRAPHYPDKGACDLCQDRVSDLSYGLSRSLVNEGAT